MSDHAFGAGHPRLIETYSFAPQRDRPVLPIEAWPRASRRRLADDADFRLAALRHRGGTAHDPDLEGGTWPELIDQTRIERICADADWWHDDAEPDDCDTGIDDEPCDALTEDGL